MSNQRERESKTDREKADNLLPHKTPEHQGVREAFLTTTTTCGREEEKKKERKKMRKGLEVGENGENYPRAGEEQEKVEEMLRLRRCPPSPSLNPRRRQGGCKVKAGTLSLSLRATQSQASEM